MNVHTTLRKLLFAVFLTACLAVGASAQSSTASMFGTVTDPSGATIPGATVTITQTDTNTVRTVQSNGAGEYRADFLPVGPYKVSVTAKGFKTYEQNGINLTVTENAQLDFPLVTGGSSETIEVTAEVPLLNTGNSTLGRTVGNEEIDNLPLVDRNVYQLLDLTPGVQNNNAAGSGANGGVINPLGYPEQHVKINGSTDSAVGQVAYYLDGGSNMTGLRNTGNPLPNPDAIREFRVDTNNFSAQYGRNSAGVVSVITKSGTNQFHGSLFEFYRTKNFNATPRRAVSKQDYNQHRFGGTIGGPIIKDKVFGFFSYGGFRFKAANLFTPLAPSAAMYTGDFSENTPTTANSSATYAALTGTAACTTAAYSATVFWACNPDTKLPYANNKVPTADQDPTIVAMIKAGLFPLPNPAASDQNKYQVRVYSPYTQKTDEELYKGDYQMTQKQRLTLTYFHVFGDYVNNPSGNNVLNWTTHDYTFNQHEANVAHTWQWSNSTVNSLTFNYTRLIGGRVPSPTDSLANYGSAFQEQLPNGTICGVPAQAGCTRPQISVASWFTAGNAITGPVTGSNIYVARDVVSSVHGKHTLYFGGEGNRENDAQQTTLNSYGVFSFSQTTNGNKRSNTSIEDFLFGRPASMTQDVPVYANVAYFNYGAFFQDDWRILPRLTLNLGVRYDIQTAPTNTQDMFMTFVPGAQSTVAPTLPKGILLPGDQGLPRSVVSTQFGHVSPRVGLAWTPYPNGRTVVHAAGGLFYGSIGGNLFAYPSNGEPFSGRPTFNKVISVSNPYATDPAEFCGGDPTCIAGGVGKSPYPFVYDPKNPKFVVVPAALISLDKDFKWPVIYQINAGIEQQLTNSFAFAASYVAALGRKLPTQWDINYPQFNVAPSGTAMGASCFTTGTTADTTLPCGYTNTTSNVDNRRPYNSKTYAATANTTAANPYYKSIMQIRSSESTSYHALQVTARQRLSHGFSVQGFWVWSKNLQSMDMDASGNTGNSATTEPEDNRLHYLDRQRSDYDQRHTVAISGVYKPRFAFHNRASRFAANGWTVTAIVQMQSGAPVNITAGADDNFDGVNNDRPNLAPGYTKATLKDNGRSRTAMAAQWMDIKQFCRWNNTVAGGSAGTIPACPQNGAGPLGSDGTVRQNTLDGPGRRVVSASIFRDFPLWEKVKFQLRGEATNVFNLINLPNPTATVTSGAPAASGGTGSFGQINGAITAGTFGPRIIQVGGRILF